MINRTEVTNETIIADKFNSYFINIAHALVKEIQWQAHFYLYQCLKQKFIRNLSYLFFFGSFP